MTSQMGEVRRFLGNWMVGWLVMPLVEQITEAGESGLELVESRLFTWNTGMHLTFRSGLWVGPGEM